jgi:hypothetical protein
MANGTVTLYNPWGINFKGETKETQVIPYKDFQANFNIISVT